MPDPVEFDDTAILVLVKRVADLLSGRGAILTTAESCTGGWIAKACTDVAGSSEWFDSGYAAYSYRAKEDLLGVSHRDLDYLIDRLQHDPMVDQLRIRRLKKRKLLIKDMITNLESELIPDLDA